MILTGSAILKRMADDFPDRLVIVPIIGPNQIQPNEGSVDLRIAHEFMVGQRSTLEAVDPLKVTRGELAGGYLQRLYIPPGDQFVLHPRQFALGATLEYVRLPGNICAEVIGRSRWARIGLIIAMATFVHPGYAGCLTLELQNLGDIPINLYPGLPIAQIIFQSCTPVPHVSEAQRTCAIGPEPPELLSDEDRMLICSGNCCKQRVSRWSGLANQVE